MKRILAIGFAALCAWAGSALAAQTLSPAIGGITASGFTVTWTTSQNLNTQLHYGAGNISTTSAVWTLSTSHSVAVTGLKAATAYEVEAESSDYTDPDLKSGILKVTTLGAAAPPATPPVTPPAAPTLSTPVFSDITDAGFTVSWTSSTALTSIVHFGIGSTGSKQTNSALVTSHSVALTGLQAATAYDVQVESANTSGTDLLGPNQSVTTAAAASAPPPATTAARLFPAAAADWLYSAPTGSYINISSMVSSLPVSVNVHTGGFDYPVQYTTGANGCVTFTDTEYYDLKDKYCVPVPTGGTWVPSVGGYGANDGHLVVVDTATNTYYDFWKLLVNASGQPTSTNVGQIVSGSLTTGNGTPGTTAAVITGLAGDILPGELDCATCLQHALNVVVPGTMNSNLVGTEAPAEKTDGTVSGAIFREGAKIRMDPSVDISTLGASVAAQAIMNALQLYGGVITDQTGGDGISLYSALPTAPDLTGIDLITQHLFIYY